MVVVDVRVGPALARHVPRLGDHDSLRVGEDLDPLAVVVARSPRRRCAGRSPLRPCRHRRGASRAVSRYVELHCHSAYRSWTAPRGRRNSCCGRGTGTRRSRSPITTGCTACSSSAYAATEFGVRAITGAEVTLGCGSHVTLWSRRPRATPTSAAFPDRRARGEASSRGSDQALLEERNDGLVCLSGCARTGLAVRNPNGAARLAQAFGPERFLAELQRPFSRGDARRNAALRQLGQRRSVLRTVVTERARPRRFPGAAPGRARRRPAPDVARGLRGGAAGKRRVRAFAAYRGRGALAGRPRGARGLGRARRPAPLRPDRGARLSLPGLRMGPIQRTSSWPGSRGRRSRSATATRSPACASARTSACVKSLR